MFKIIENQYLHEELLSIGVIVFFLLFKFIVAKSIKKYASLNDTLEHRTNLVIKYINILLGILSFISIIIIWGVKKDQIFLFISSIFTVVGVASFAQWSILSNITSGIIIFFSYPFKIGDIIEIHDKDYPIRGEIEDIKAFYILLKTKERGIITYPNNLLMQKGISVIKLERNLEEHTD